MACCTNHVTHLPWELLIRYVPLESLPENHSAREDIHFVIVLRMRMPELRRLPVNSPDETANHGTRRLLDLGQAEVRDLRRPVPGDEDIRGLAVAMNDGGLAQVQVLQAFGDTEHDAKLQGMSFLETNACNR